MINWPLVRKKSATAPDDPAATGVASYSESTEYGAPRKPATADDGYGWLGSKQRSTNDLAGLTDMGMRLYNPATGRFLSVDPVAGGNANPYTYPVDPIDRFDLNGACGWCHRLWNDVKAVGHQIKIAVLGPSIPGTMTVGKLAAYIKHHFKGFVQFAGIVACTFATAGECLFIATIATVVADTGGFRHMSSGTLRDMIHEELLNLAGYTWGHSLDAVFEGYSASDWRRWGANLAAGYLILNTSNMAQGPRDNER